MKTTVGAAIRLGSKCELGLIGTVGDLLLRVSIMAQQLEKTLHNASLALGAFLLTMVVVVGINSFRRGSWIDLVPKEWRHLHSVGRLDYNSEGLIFLTNDGDIVNKILRASNDHEKEYLVTVNRPITDEFIAAMAGGVPILGVMTKKCIVKKESPFIFKIILIQGLNRQIRRMCEHFNY